jgi:hypothetical protein
MSTRRTAAVAAPWIDDRDHTEPRASAAGRMNSSRFSRNFRSATAATCPKAAPTAALSRMTVALLDGERSHRAVRMRMASSHDLNRRVTGLTMMTSS